MTFILKLPPLLDSIIYLISNMHYHEDLFYLLPILRNVKSDICFYLCSYLLFYIKMSFFSFMLNIIMEIRPFKQTIQIHSPYMSAVIFLCQWAVVKILKLQKSKYSNLTPGTFKSFSNNSSQVGATSAPPSLQRSLLKNPFWIWVPWKYYIYFPGPDSEATGKLSLCQPPGNCIQKLPTQSLPLQTSPA